MISLIRASASALSAAAAFDSLSSKRAFLRTEESKARN
jgi:hypothetical protein